MVRPLFRPLAVRLIAALTVCALGCGTRPTPDPPAAQDPGQLLGPYEKAIEDEFTAANAAVERTPDSAPALADRGRAHLRFRRLPAALADLNRAIELQPDLAVGYARRAGCLLVQGDVGKAGEDCEAAIRHDPGCAEAYLARAAVRAAAGQTRSALDDCDRAISLNPSAARAYLVRGMIQQGTDRDRATADYTDAIRLDRLLAPAYYQRGLTYAKRGEVERAKADWREAVSLNPHGGDAHIALGIAAEQAGDFDTAIAEIATGLAQNNADPSITRVGLVWLSYAYYIRACGCVQRGEIGPAETDLVECVRLYQDADLAHALLAEVYCDRGRYSDAIRHIDLACGIDKNLGPDRKRYLNDLRRWAADASQAPVVTPTPPTIAPIPTATSPVGPTSGGFNLNDFGPQEKGRFERLADRLFTPENAGLALAVVIGGVQLYRDMNQPPVVPVEGHWRNGTYVRPHVRSWPSR